jgi:hypothetical protein
VAVAAVDPNLAISGIYGVIICTVGDTYTINFSATPKEPDDAPTQWTVDWGDGSRNAKGARLAQRKRCQPRMALPEAITPIEGVRSTRRPRLR